MLDASLNPDSDQPVQLTVLVIENEPAAGPGSVGRWLIEEGLALKVCRPYAGDPIPDSVEEDGLVVLGGSVGTYDDTDAPWLPATRALLRRAVADEVPMLGICLGAQLLATALGGEVLRGSDGPEAGVQPLYVDAGDDAIFSEIPSRSAALQFHQDVITRLPEGAIRLASSDAYENQAFRVGQCAWAVQFHPEVTSDDLESWARAYPAVLSNRHDSADDVVRELHEKQSDLDAIWAPVTRRWAEQVRIHARKEGN